MPACQRRPIIKTLMVKGWTDLDMAELFSLSKILIAKDKRIIRQECWIDIQTDIGAQKLLEEITKDLRINVDVITAELWKLFGKTTNDSVKLGCLKQLQRCNTELLGALQSLGLIQKTPDRLEHIGAMKIELKVWEPEVDPRLKDYYAEQGNNKKN